MEAGRQIVDIGSGLPAQGNVHEIAHQTAPGTRVTYVDYDPVVCSHARALLGGDPNVSAVRAGPCGSPEDWRPDPDEPRLEQAPSAGFSGVGRKP